MTAPIPPEARGRIGAQAAAWGLGTKAEADAFDLDGQARPPTGYLLPMPVQAHPSWPAEEADRKGALSARVAAAGDVGLANLWRSNLARPRSPYCDLAALERVADRLEHRAQGLGGDLPSVQPSVLYGQLEEIPAVRETAAYPAAVLPAAIGAAIVEAVNAALRKIALAGFASRSEVNAWTAPRKVLDLSSTVSRIIGASVRAINQVGHLQAVSRAGQTAHAPMTLLRRLALVDAALAGVAEAAGVRAWPVAAADLATPAVRAAWAAREDAEPLPAAFARNLFEWAAGSRPEPASLAEPGLKRMIQQHLDMSYVDQLRAERLARQSVGDSTALSRPQEINMPRNDLVNAGRATYLRRTAP